MKVIIENLIDKRLSEYKDRTGESKVEVSKKLNISKQGLDNLINSKNPKTESLIKVSHVIGCKPEDLYSYKIVEE